MDCCKVFVRYITGVLGHNKRHSRGIPGGYDAEHYNTETIHYRRLPAGEETVQTKVLVIDDDIEMTDLLRIILVPEHFEVTTANSGTKGVELSRQIKPDVIILDLLMPVIDGWQVCREIRKFSQVPIIILSAVNKPGMVAHALDEGADDFLLKPVPSGVLIAHINKFTRRINTGCIIQHPKIDTLL